MKGNYVILPCTYFEEVKHGELRSASSPCHVPLERFAAAPCERRAPAFELEIQSCQTELLSRAAASAVTSGTVWKWRGAYLAFFIHTCLEKWNITRDSSSVRWFQSPRRASSWCTLCFCKTHHYSWTMCDTMATATQAVCTPARQMEGRLYPPVYQSCE